MERTALARARIPGFRTTLTAMQGAFYCVVALIVLSGCALELWETIPEPIAEDLAAQRAESLIGWENVVVNGRSLSSSLVRGTPLLVSSSLDISTKLEIAPRDPEDRESGFRSFGLSFDWKAKGGESFGAAAVLANDGYFLTAAHVVDELPMDLIALVPDDNGDPIPRRSPVRIVWSSGDPSGDFDIAVIHADVGPLKALELAGSIPVTEDPIVTGGWPMQHLGKGSGRSRISAGRILSVTERDSKDNIPAFTIVRHDAPILHGDSGAPVLNREGRLLGVNCKVNYDIAFWDVLAALLGRKPDRIDAGSFTGEAILPDPDWLRKVIGTDRRERAADSLPVGTRQGD